MLDLRPHSASRSSEMRMNRAPMTRRDFARLAVVAVPTVPAWLARGPSNVIAAPAAQSYDDWIVIDALGGPGERVGAMGGTLSGQALADARDSGITAVNLTVGTVGDGDGLFEASVRSVAEWQRRIAEHPDHLTAVRTADDIREAKATGRLGIIFGLQDAAMLEGELDRVDLFHDLGVKIIQLTYNRSNELGDGAIEPENRGLTAFGREVVDRMNRLGALVDLSHCGQLTTDDGIRASSVPVSITHSGCRSLADLPRNKTDATLRLLADNGGVVGIYLMPFLLEQGQPHAEDVIRHLEHALEVCGEDHVGIGTDGRISGLELTPDFLEQHRKDVEDRRARGISAPGETADVFTYVPELNTPRRFETLGDMLSARGHSTTRIEKVLGGNFMRLMEAVW